MTRLSVRFAGWLTVLVALGACDDGGGPADADADADTDADFMGDPCLGRGRFVFLLDIDHRLLRLEPTELTIREVGPLECDTDETPISMSIDRDGVAWVLHGDGRIYHVSTTDAACTPTTFVANQEDFEVFGMGFVSLSAGSEDETLYVAGGRYADFVPGGTSRLGRIDPASLTLTPIGALPGWPELTGTGAGELWAFFPDTSPVAVMQLDRETAGALRTIELTELDVADVINWAFAFWGGDLFLFLQQRLDPATSIWRLDPETGDLSEAVPDTGYSIVGAGVSTCAPLEII